MTHYETLGVPKDAPPEQIKKAYRKKAQKTHPDKGGKHEEMAALTRAYDTLKDDDKRARYDATGKDGSPLTLEQEAEAHLTGLFSVAIENAAPGKVLNHIRSNFANTLAQIKHNNLKAEAKIAKLEKARAAISAKGDVNIAHRIIDDQISNIRSAVKQNEHTLEVVEVMKTKLTEYEESSVEIAPEPPRPGFFGEIRFTMGNDSLEDQIGEVYRKYGIGEQNADEAVDI